MSGMLLKGMAHSGQKYHTHTLCYRTLLLQIVGHTCTERRGMMIAKRPAVVVLVIGKHPHAELLVLGQQRVAAPIIRPTCC